MDYFLLLSVIGKRVGGREGLRVGTLWQLVTSDAHINLAQRGLRPNVPKSQKLGTSYNLSLDIFLHFYFLSRDFFAYEMTVKTK